MLTTRRYFLSRSGALLLNLLYAVPLSAREPPIESYLGVELQGTGLRVERFPLRGQWLRKVRIIGGFTSDMKYVGSNGSGEPGDHAIGSRIFSFDNAPFDTNLIQVDYLTPNGWRRCFVGIPTIRSAWGPTISSSPVLLFALPSSSPVGYDGARDMFESPPGSGDIQYQWPIKVSCENGAFCVLIDLPRYGMNPYLPTDACQTIVDVIAGMDAAIACIHHLALFSQSFSGLPGQKIAIENIVGGGLSYGSIIAMFIGAALTDIDSLYLAGTYPKKSFQAYSNPPYPADFYPVDWVDQEYDYPDMLLASNAKRIVMQWGPSAPLPYGDYANYPPFNPHNLEIAERLRKADPRRFSYFVASNSVTQGHEINEPHLKLWFKTRLKELNQW